MKRPSIAQLVCIAALTSAAAATAQRGPRGLVRLQTDGAFDRASAVWVAPDGSRTPFCAAGAAASDPCAIPWTGTPGRYRFESGLEPTERAPSRFEFSLDRDTIAIELAATQGHLNVSILGAPPSGLRLEPAPAPMRTPTCRFVIHNASADRTLGGVDAWVVEPSLRDAEWEAHAHGQHSAMLDADARRCLVIRPEQQAAARLRRLVVYVPTMVADTAGYAMTLMRSIRITAQ